jgi:hypothetical protein
VRACAAVALGALFALAPGCTAIRPAELAGGPAVARVPFSHEELAIVLERYVNDRGQVDYQSLLDQPLHLERYYFLLGKYSPDSHPEYFPTREHQLAYWINAYNAAVLQTVLRHYPIGSVDDVRAPVPLRYVLPRKAGFFVFQRIRLGERGTNLYWLENRVIRRRFRDPRIHFVLSCASAGCPYLSAAPMNAATLEEQLDGAARAFLGDSRNVRIDHEQRIVRLSAIFDWYERDFRSDDGGTLIDYVRAHAPAELAAELEQAAGYGLDFLAYDWSLNDWASGEVEDIPPLEDDADAPAPVAPGVGEPGPAGPRH